MLELILINDTFGSYKDLEIEMRLNNLQDIEILETKYCFKHVEDYRKLSYKDILELSLVDSLEKIKYQQILKKSFN